MNVVKGVLTSFRSMHALEGLGVAGTSGITNVCKSSCKALNPCTAISGAGSAGVPQAQLITARIQQLLAANGASVLTRHATPVRNLARFLQTQPNRLHPRAWSLTPHNSLRTQQSAKSRWQRDYYSSAYGRGYGSAWDGDKVLYGLIAANCAGYFLWQSSPGLMSKQATVSINSIREGRLHTLLTSAFSHASLNHLFANMFTFYFFGREIGQTFGGKKLLGLYAAGAVAGSAAHVIYYWVRAQSSSAIAWVKEANMARSPPALGASAAVNAVVLLSVLLWPSRTVLIYAVLPVPAALLGILYIGGDMFGALGGHGGNVAYAGHLGGAAVGALAFFALRRGRIRW